MSATSVEDHRKNLSQPRLNKKRSLFLIKRSLNSFNNSKMPLELKASLKKQKSSMIHSKSIKKMKNKKILLFKMK